MKIQFTRSCVGQDFSFPAHAVRDLPDDFAAGFIKSGLAVPVKDEVIEAAVAPEVERAVLPTPKKHRR